MEAALLGPGGRIPLTGGPLTLGRTPDNQYVVNDSKASSHHAELRSNGQQYAITDLGSMNGTFVNDQRLERAMPRGLVHGDRIRIGDTLFTYEVQPSAPFAQSNQPVYGSTVYGGTPSGAGYLPTQMVQPSQGMPPVQPPAQSYQPPAPQSYGAPGSSGDAYNDYGGSNPYIQYAPPPPPAPPISAPSYSGVPSYAPPAPGAFGTPPSAPSGGKKSRTRLWIILGLVALLLLGGIGGGIFFVVNQPTPGKALDKFCTAVKAGDFSTAYSQLSPALQSKAPQSVFSLLFARVDSCTYTSPAQTGSKATSTLTLSSTGKNSNHPVSLLQDSSGAWKIDDDPTLTALPQTLAGYCAALKGGDYQTAYNTLTPTFQGKLSRPIFTLFEQNVTNCTYVITNITGGSATASIAITGGAQLETNQAALQQQNDLWKIDSLSALSTPIKTLLGFCLALKGGDDQSAFNLLSQGFRDSIQGGEGRFANSLNSVVNSNGGISKCDTTGVQPGGNNAIGSIVLTYNNGKTETDKCSLTIENDIWKITAFIQ